MLAGAQPLEQGSRKVQREGRDAARAADHAGLCRAMLAKQE